MLLGVVLVGCSPVDGARLGIEALKVRWHRVPLAKALSDEEIGADWRRNIETVVTLRRFAASLGLEPGDTFATFTRLDLDHPGYLLMASPRASLQPYAWWTPTLDTVPYKGFLELRLARDEAALLEHQGYDTYIRIASTFRSFGCLAPPLLDEHLRRAQVPLARLVLREIQRSAFALPGAPAVPFNESFASFVGYRGAIAYFEARAPESASSRIAHVSWKAERRYGAYLTRLAAALRGAYRTAGNEPAALAAKARLFEAAKNDLHALSAHYESLGIPRLRVPRNNAAVLYDLYRTSGFDLFEAVHARTHDLRRTLDLITRAAAARPDAPYEAIRDALVDGGPTPPLPDLIPTAPSIPKPRTVEAPEDPGDLAQPRASLPACPPEHDA